MPLVIGNVYIQETATLTINPGSVIKFFERGFISVDGGTLIVQGSPAGRVYFTSLRDDTVGGDTNGDGNDSTPRPGDYVGINVGRYARVGTADVNYAVFRYGGQSTCCENYGVIQNSSGVVRIANTRITDSIYGVRQRRGQLTINNSLISRNGPYGVYVDNGFLTLTNSVFGGHTLADGYLTNLRSFVNFGNQNLTGGKQGLYIGNTTASQTWNPGIVFIGGHVAPNVTLTVNPGVIVKLLTSYMRVDGSLIIQGIPESRVYFTSIKDDTVGGDTNGDGSASSPVLGENGYNIAFVTGSVADIRNAVFRYGGSTGCCTDYHGAINNLGGAVNISNTLLHDNVVGIRTNNSSLTISQSSLYRNVYYGLFNGTLGLINAGNNWWGSDTGPTHASNPGGTGDRVSDYVTFTPWLTRDPNN